MERTERALLDLNRASQRELTQLPRIGSDKARNIVHYRAIRKGFRDWADFAQTSGLSEEDVEVIRARARIGPRPDKDAPVAAASAGPARRRGPVRRPRSRSL